MCTWGTDDLELWSFFFIRRIIDMAFSIDEAMSWSLESVGDVVVIASGSGQSPQTEEKEEENKNL